MPIPDFTKKTEVEEVMAWHDLPLKSVPSDCLDTFEAYCESEKTIHERAIDILERKADWLMTLTVGVVGVALLRLTDAEHITVEPYTWIVAQLLAAWGMLFCIRARLPQQYPSLAKPIELANWLNEYQSWHAAHPGAPCPKTVSRLQVAKLNSYSSAVMKLVAEWKSNCVRAAGGLLMAAFALLVVSFWQSSTATHEVKSEPSNVNLINFTID